MSPPKSHYISQTPPKLRNFSDLATLKILLWTELCLPKFVCWSLTTPSTKSDGIWRCGLRKVIRLRWGHESGTHMMGSVLLLEETPNSFLPYENTVSEKTASCKPGEEPSPRTTSASSLILDFSASITEISEREMPAAQATQSMAFSYSSQNT